MYLIKRPQTHKQNFCVPPVLPNTELTEKDRYKREYEKEPIPDISTSAKAPPAPREFDLVDREPIQRVKMVGDERLDDSDTIPLLPKGEGKRLPAGFKLRMKMLAQEKKRHKGSGNRLYHITKKPKVEKRSKRSDASFLQRSMQKPRKRMYKGEGKESKISMDVKGLNNYIIYKHIPKAIKELGLKPIPKKDLRKIKLPKAGRKVNIKQLIKTSAHTLPHIIKHLMKHRKKGNGLKLSGQGLNISGMGIVQSLQKHRDHLLASFSKSIWSGLQNILKQRMGDKKSISGSGLVVSGRGITVSGGAFKDFINVIKKVFKHAGHVANIAKAGVSLGSAIVGSGKKKEHPKRKKAIKTIGKVISTVGKAMPFLAVL